MSGVMPVIFASALASIPGTIGGFFPNLYNAADHPFAAPFLRMFSTTGWVYAAIYLLLIIAFNYFYVAMQYNPVEIANNPGHRGGPSHCAGNGYGRKHLPGRHQLADRCRRCAGYVPQP